MAALFLASCDEAQAPTLLPTFTATSTSTSTTTSTATPSPAFTATSTPVPTFTATPAPTTAATATTAPTPEPAYSADTDRAALVALYNATAGANWTNNTSWLSDAPLEEWYGVTTDDDGRVTELDLFRNNMTGEIPPELSRLSSLEVLGLSGNQLSGQIPPELSGLFNLKVLWLSSNQFTGKFRQGWAASPT